MIKYLDIPPMWLGLAMGLAWVQAGVLPMGDVLDTPLIRGAAVLLAVAGVVLIGLAVVAFWQARTTIIPHQMPQNMITTGVFALSRNPIYLGDALLLCAFVLWVEATLSLFLVPLFVLFIQVRFIRVEEKRLHDLFGDAFRTYCDVTRRWI